MAKATIILDEIGINLIGRWLWLRLLCLDLHLQLRVFAREKRIGESVFHGGGHR